MRSRSSTPSPTTSATRAAAHPHRLQHRRDGARVLGKRPGAVSLVQLGSPRFASSGRRVHPRGAPDDLTRCDDAAQTHTLWCREPRGQAGRSREMPPASSTCESPACWAAFPEAPVPVALEEARPSRATGVHPERGRRGRRGGDPPVFPTSFASLPASRRQHALPRPRSCCSSAVSHWPTWPVPLQVVLDAVARPWLAAQTVRRALPLRRGRVPPRFRARARPTGQTPCRPAVARCTSGVARTPACGGSEARAGSAERPTPLSSGRSRGSGATAPSRRTRAVRHGRRDRASGQDRGGGSRDSRRGMAGSQRDRTRGSSSPPPPCEGRDAVRAPNRGCFIPQQEGLVWPTLITYSHRGLHLVRVRFEQALYSAALENDPGPDRML